MNNQILLAYETRSFSRSKIKFQKILNFEILILSLGGVRVLSGLANLSSKSHFSNPCSFRHRRFHDFFKNFQKNLDNKKFRIWLNISILLLETIRVLSGVANPASEYDC